MALRLFNTLTQQVEEFRPLRENQVGMYTCGPTVYDYVHIGNLRTFVFQDLLRRYLKYRGFDLFHVMNITDVEDKIIGRARETGVTIQEYTARYEQAFLEDMETLRIQRPEIMPRATEHVPEMLELVDRLQAKGLTYQQDGSTYFRIDGLPDYGKLSRLSLEPESTPSARLDDDEYSKENPRDFVLWKAHKSGEAFWEAEIGAGRPGWHLECSAMSMKYLGESFDIHCGGIDLVFPHHENEIAQSEGATGKPFVKYWIHGAHLIVDGEKMSKSKGNFYTLRDLLDQDYPAEAIRYLLASVHYRKQLNFTIEGLRQASASLQRINDFLRRVREISESAPAGRIEDRIERARQEFEAGMDNDLNSSEALAALFSLIKKVNILLDNRQVSGRERDLILKLFQDANLIYDVFQLAPESLDDAEIETLIEERQQARLARNYQRADEIRDGLETRGIVLEDTKEGTRWKKVK